MPPSVGRVGVSVGSSEHNDVRVDAMVLACVKPESAAGGALIDNECNAVVRLELSATKRGAALWT